MEIILASLSLLLAAVPALLFIRNLTLYNRPEAQDRSPCEVSVLIPARNEEKTVGAAVASVLGNTGARIEVLVLDDGSTDCTALVVDAIAGVDPRVRLLRSEFLPEGWCGKQHACAQLSQTAKYPLLCFIDSDVILSENSLVRMASFLRSRGVSLASGIPFQKVVTPLEQLLIPLVHFVLLGFLPIARMRRSTHPSYAAGCGQLFIADAIAYRKAGGHAVIRATLHDGINLPRAFRRAGFKTDLFDATDIASCRMYYGAKEVWNGLLKNAAEGLASPRLIVPATLSLALGQIAPLLLVATTDSLARILAVTALLFSYLPRVLGIARFRQPVWSAVFHPIGIFLLLVIQWHALFRQMTGRRAQWKGRSYGRVPPAHAR